MSKETLNQMFEKHKKLAWKITELNQEIEELEREIEENKNEELDIKFQEEVNENLGLDRVGN